MGYVDSVDVFRWHPFQPTWNWLPALCCQEETNQHKVYCIVIYGPTGRPLTPQQRETSTCNLPFNTAFSCIPMSPLSPSSAGGGGERSQVRTFSMLIVYLVTVGGIAPWLFQIRVIDWCLINIYDFLVATTIHIPDLLGANDLQIIHVAIT